MSAFKPLEEMRPIVLADGIKARAVNGERLTMAVVDLAPNAISPEHKHENEQLEFVIRSPLIARAASPSPRTIGSRSFSELKVLIRRPGR